MGKPNNFLYKLAANTGYGFIADVVVGVYRDLVRWVREKKGNEVTEIPQKQGHTHGNI